MKLLPYLYSAFYEYNQKGIPPFRAMVLESGYDSQETLNRSELDDAKNPYAEQKRMEVTDQYMMGPSILVAPVFTGQKERTVVLPKGNWFDFYTGEYAGNGETITIKTKLEEIPLFVKDGGVIPMLTTIDKNESDQTLEVRHYGTKENSYFLYNDDGISYDYERGEYSLTELKSIRNIEGELKGSAIVLKENKSTYGDIVWRWMTVKR
jgi:alpha-D-xyloside xylohydrolase